MNKRESNDTMRCRVHADANDIYDGKQTNEPTCVWAQTHTHTRLNAIRNDIFPRFGFFLFGFPLEISNTKRANINCYTCGVAWSYSTFCVFVTANCMHFYTVFIVHHVTCSFVTHLRMDIFCPSHTVVCRRCRCRHSKNGKQCVPHSSTQRRAICLFVLWKWIFRCVFLPSSVVWIRVQALPSTADWFAWKMGSHWHNGRCTLKIEMDRRRRIII